MDEPVAILGCGPAGLFVAQACKLVGRTPVIISKKKKSVIYGAQYLHKPIPGFCNATPDGELGTFLLGKQENYAKRVYDDETAHTSWEKAVTAPHGIWNLRQAYDRAWDEFEEQILDMPYDGEDVAQSIKDFDVVISTIPLWSICQSTHKFDSVSILVKKEMEYTGLPFHFTEHNGAVVYNGTEHGYWYRTSTIFGHGSTETRGMPYEFPLEGSGWEPGFKVVGNNCDCHPGLVRAGRMGKWQAGVLTHHAFEETIDLLTGDRSVAH